MNLNKKKKFIARVLGVGAGRIKLNPEMLAEIKEAITRQDINDLFREKIIRIKDIRGKKKKEKRKRKRGHGSRKQTIRRRKKGYVRLTRKLRNYTRRLKNDGKISKKDYSNLRKKIKAKGFKDFSYLKQAVKEKK